LLHAQVGVDVNAAAATPWRAPPLAFVAGLGPRKAQALLRAAVREKGVQARADLWRQPNNPDQPPLTVFGRCVFRCACRPRCISRTLRAGRGRQPYHLLMSLVGETSVHAGQCAAALPALLHDASGSAGSISQRTRGPCSDDQRTSVPEPGLISRPCPARSNCAGFLRVRASTPALANAEMDALDDTRVHPSSYAPASDMALSAVGVRGEGAGDAARAAALERAMARPHDVEDLDLEARPRGPRAQSGALRMWFHVPRSAADLDMEACFRAPSGTFWVFLQCVHDESCFRIVGCVLLQHARPRSPSPCRSCASRGTSGLALQHSQDHKP